MRLIFIKDHEVERLFWSQFSAPTRPLLLNEQMAEWAELHRLSGLAMRSVSIIFGRRGQDRIFILV